MFNNYPTKADAKEQAEDYAEPLDALISPSDVSDGAEAWSDIDTDVLKQEVWESVSVIRSEHDTIRHLIKDHAFRLWTRDLSRQPREVLDSGVSDEDLIHEHSIWPYDMNKWDCYEICHQVYETPDREIPQGYIDDAEVPVYEGLFDGTMPDEVTA